jgi:DHA1 family inner membrane transport protein
LLFLAWLSAFTIPASLQSRLIREANEAPNFASTLMNTASQVGIATGAALGGYVIAGGWSYSQLPLVASGFSTVALVLTLFLFSYDRRALASA